MKQKLKKEPMLKIGAVLIENKTGRILGFVAGRDFEAEPSGPRVLNTPLSWFNHQTNLGVRASD